MKSKHFWAVLLLLPLILFACKEDEEKTFNLPNIKLISPATGDYNVPVKPTFEWLGTDDKGEPLVYDLYLGHDSLSLHKEAGALKEMTFTLSEYMLKPNQMFFWKVIAWNTSEFRESKVWRFTTGPPPTE